MESLVSRTWVLPPFLGFYVTYILRYKQKCIKYGGHFEIQDCGQTKLATTNIMVLMESLMSQTWVLPPFLIFYVAHKPRYRAKYIEKWRPF
jgi:hypothetical protein